MPHKDPGERRIYHKNYHKEWYKSNKEKRIRQIRKREIEINGWYREYKARMKCSRCPENDVRCLEFHHVGKKDFNISIKAHQGYSIERLKAEIAKCIPLCANCHRKETFSHLVK